MKPDIFRDEPKLVKFRCPECGKKFLTLPGVRGCPFCHALAVETLMDLNKRPKDDQKS